MNFTSIRNLASRITTALSRKPKTAQEIFDVVVAHLRKQQYRSTLGGGCAYRGDDGKKCAIGVLIPDHLYVPEMERRPVMYILRADGFGGLEHLQPHALLLHELQGVHDGVMPDCGEYIDYRVQLSKSFEGEVKSIANRFNLTYHPHTWVFE